MKYRQSPFEQTRGYPGQQEAPPLNPGAGLQFDPARLLPQQQTVEPSAVVENLRYGRFNNVPLNIGLQDVLVLPAPISKRVYLMIQNTHAIQNLFVTYGNQSNSQLGLRLGPNGSLTLDSVVSQDDIHIIADGAGTTGVLIYCDKNPNEV